MSDFKNLFQSSDWKVEKHMPVIDSPDKVIKGEFFIVKITVGKDIPHPNKTEHHIRWVDVYFLPDGEKFPYQITRTEFSAHGESTQGPDTSTVYTNHSIIVSFKTSLSGTIYATSLCNIHGLWQNSKQIIVE